MALRPYITSVDRAEILADATMIRRRPNQTASKEAPFNPYHFPRDVFERIDTNQNGELDRTELIAKLLTASSAELRAHSDRHIPVHDLLKRDGTPLTARQVADRHTAESAQAVRELEAERERARPRVVGQTAQGDPLISVGPISITGIGTDLREALAVLHERRQSQASKGDESIFVETAQGYVEVGATAFKVSGGALPRFGETLTLLPPNGAKVEGKVVGIVRPAQVGAPQTPATEPIVINIMPPQTTLQTPPPIVTQPDLSYRDRRTIAKDAADLTNTILEGLGAFFRNHPGGG